MGPMIKGLIGKRKQAGGATQKLSQTMHQWGILLLCRYASRDLAYNWLQDQGNC